MAARQIIPDQALLNQGIAPNYGAMQEAANAEETARVEKQQRMDRYNALLTDAMSKAPTYGINYAHSIGVNPDDPRNRGIIDQIVSSISAGIPRNQDSSIDPTSYFSPEAFGEGFADYQSRARQANSARVQSTFKPGVEYDLLPDSSVDSIVDQIINEQRGLANTTLDYQSKRGLLTPQGSEQARQSLEGQTGAARSTLSGLATGALDKDRELLRSIIGEAGSTANRWQLGAGEFDVSPFMNRLQSTAQREAGSFGGDVRAALGNTQLFDIPSIIAQAGTAQGAQNLTTGDPATFGMKKKPQNRGLDSAGGTF